VSKIAQSSSRTNAGGSQNLSGQKEPQLGPLFIFAAEALP